MKVKGEHGSRERGRAGWRRSGYLSGSADGRSVRQRGGAGKSPGAPESWKSQGSSGSLQLGPPQHTCAWGQHGRCSPQVPVSSIAPALASVECSTPEPGPFSGFLHLSATPLIPPSHLQPIREPQRSPPPPPAAAALGVFRCRVTRARLQKPGPPLAPPRPTPEGGGGFGSQVLVPVVGPRAKRALPVIALSGGGTFFTCALSTGRARIPGTGQGRELWRGLWLQPSPGSP